MPPPPAPPLPKDGKIDEGNCRISGKSDLGDSRETASALCERAFSNDSFNASQLVVISKYTPVQPTLQEGPSCGLAALCMAGNMLTGKSDLQLKVVLEEAKRMGYTSRGEMFSACNMAELASSLLDCKVELLDNGLQERSRIIEHLLRANPILVPYDCDKNHEPCLRNGHKAHWAVICGFVILLPGSCLPALNPPVHRDVRWPKLYHLGFGSHLDINLEDLRGEIFLYAHQGKSRRAHLWSYESLSSSNTNLFELCPLRRDSFEEYTVSAAAVRGGLCDRVILISPPDNKS